MGWRYYCFTTGALVLFLWAVRFAMPLLESPRYLVGKGKDEEAVRVVHELARYNGKTSNLTVEQLLVVGSRNMENKEGGMVPGKMGLRYVSVAVRHFKGLFATKKMALSSVLICLITCTCAVLSSLALLWHNDTFCSGGWDRAVIVLHVPTIHVSPLPGRSSSSEMIPLLLSFRRIATRGAQFGDSSLDITYRNVSVVPSWFKFYGSIVNNPAPFSNSSRRRSAFLHPYSEGTSLNYPSWVGNAYWLYLQASISIFDVTPCSPLSTSHSPSCSARRCRTSR